MNKNVKTLIITAAFALVAFQFKVSANSSLGSPRINIDTNKEWTVKFSSNLEPSTVNSTNIQVTDKNNVQVPVAVTLGNDPSTVMVSPKVSGYDPSEKYNLVIGEGLKSASGKNLSNPLSMQFTTSNKYSDGTGYTDLPKITSNKFEYVPLLSSEKQGFLIQCDSSSDVQYRIFVNGQNDKEGSYTELTNGYTNEESGKITSLKTLSAGTNGEKYKAVIYVKRTGVTGAHKDGNTEYDNYFVDYFRCVDNVDSKSSEFVNYDIALDDMVNTQLNSDSTPVFVAANVMDNAATKNQIKYYADPNNFLDSYGKYQFLKLTYSDGVTADSLNNFLKGKGIFDGKGQAFLDAAKNNNISVSYLVSHAMLETGNGTSKLANGGATDSSGNYIYGVPVYNFFGINATDDNAVLNGTKTAYENGWTTVERAISGGAQWIGKWYINNPSTNQNTIYKMRWNPGNPGQHEYATDISWAYKQIPNIIKEMQDITAGSNLTLEFEIPKYK
ncbi:beta-N-acetylglucosaminidase precursor [Clostridium ragsdalei P11]|uniref:Beta-N-acetylglucosaminidase n=1 Tax=Clostridium ragsdalei P11 TaxID=1353534 RepID=A0A1A6ANX9_9CLOT|nr:glucosaminidase domain-containing protein [Clostridium ragsdalei]OBR91748.1 beta-N-acetylglucosaminidase precursor [Clostridium ragsdalei P11]